jgi:anti-sigma B factor antagonist
MEITVRPADTRHVVVEVKGRLDLTNVDTFRAAVLSTVAHGDTSVIVDFAALTFIDSSGLGALVGAYRQARDHGGDLRIVAPNPQVLDILTLMRIDRVLPPYPTIDDALKES